MEEIKLQLSSDTWAYVDRARSKLIVEIDLPQEGDDVTKKIPVQDRKDLPLR